MKISQAFPSKHLKREDLNGQEFRLTIASITQEDVSRQDEAPEVKPVVFFQEAKKGLALNITNAAAISASYGDETDGWIGRPIVLYDDPNVMFKGKRTGGLRVKIPGAMPAEPQPPVGGFDPPQDQGQMTYDNANQPVGDDDSIPF